MNTWHAYAVDAQTSRRAFLGLAAAGVARTVSACSNVVRSAAAARPAAATARPWRNPVPENALPGTSDWVIRHLGAEHEIEGYAGKASVLTGESFPLFVSTTARGLHRDRLPARLVPGARRAPGLEVAGGPRRRAEDRRRL